MTPAVVAGPAMTGGWFRRWARDGTWDRVHDQLRDRVRVGAGRDPQPSAAALDAQSVKTAEGGAARGFDAGKRVAGRKRHLLVDTMGLVLVCVVHAASVQDRAGGRVVLEQVPQRYGLLGKVWADGGYANQVDTAWSTGPGHTVGWSWRSCRARPGSGALSPCRAAG